MVNSKKVESRGSRFSRLACFIAKTTGGGLISYAAPRLLVAVGFPLDEWIIAMGGSIHFTSETALWAVTLAIGFVLFLANSFWRKYRNIIQFGTHDELIPFIQIRQMAQDHGLHLDGGLASNLTYTIEGAIKDAAANEKIVIWGKPYNGPVHDNDPLVKIKKEHFLTYSIAHGNLHYKTDNVHTHTTTMALKLKGKSGLEGETFYDLYLSTKDAQKILDNLPASQNQMAEK